MPLSIILYPLNCWYELKKTWFQVTHWVLKSWMGNSTTHQVVGFQKHVRIVWWEKVTSLGKACSTQILVLLYYKLTRLLKSDGQPEPSFVCIEAKSRNIFEDTWFSLFFTRTLGMKQAKGRWFRPFWGWYWWIPWSGLYRLNGGGVIKILLDHALLQPIWGVSTNTEQRNRAERRPNKRDKETVQSRERAGKRKKADTSRQRHRECC